MRRNSFFFNFYAGLIEEVIIVINIKLLFYVMDNIFVLKNILMYRKCMIPYCLSDEE
jgi:hypothetical protein